jgi:TolA-binding protein
MEKARQFLNDPRTQKGMQYSAGFAAGFTAGMAKSYPGAKAEAYKEAFHKGYRRGQADWNRRNTDQDGHRLTPEGQYQRALAEFQRGNFVEAADRFDMVLAGGQAGDLTAKAMYGKARSIFMTKNYPSARKAALLLVSTLPESSLADDAAFLAIACLELHKKGGFLGFGKKPDRKAAANEFESFLLRYPESPQAPQAAFRLGMLTASLKQRQRAIEAYEKLIQQWPEHPLVPKAKRRLARLQRGR